LINDSSSNRSAIGTWILDYGNSVRDTFTQFSSLSYKYDNADTFAIDLIIIDTTGSCRDTSRNIAVILDDNDLRFGTIVADEDTCTYDSTGIIVVHSEFGGTAPLQFAFSSGNPGTARAWDNLPAGYFNISLVDAIGCKVDSSVGILNDQVTLEMYYVAESYPNNSDVNVYPLVNDSGGVFSVSSAGLSINVNTGEFNPSLSDVGTYIISYTNGHAECPQTVTDTMTIYQYVGLEELEVEENNVFPNPFENDIVIQTGKVGSTIELYNVLGEQLLIIEQKEKQQKIDLAAFSSGVYYLKVNGLTHKLIKRSF